MSRNRTTTDCDCGLWLFTPDLEIPASDSSLLTLDAYLDTIGWARDRYRHGYGYCEDLAGPVVPSADRYRWRRIQCPICRRSYAGWYRRQPALTTEAPVYELYDSSYWFSFNDEPSEPDWLGVETWTPADLVAAVEAWRKRR